VATPDLSRPLLDADAIADLLGITRGSVFNLARRNRDPLPSVRIGRARRFVRSEVEAWVDRQRDRT
jgi:excisionase family DNA binding protein